MEKFSREELAEVFDLSDCSRASARIDWKKLEWLNGQYMKEADDDRLAKLVASRIEARGGIIANGPDLASVCGLLKSRSATLENSLKLRSSSTPKMPSTLKKPLRFSPTADAKRLNSLPRNSKRLMRKRLKTFITAFRK